jgi:hypothetical protein
MRVDVTIGKFKTCKIIMKQSVGDKGGKRIKEIWT